MYKGHRALYWPSRATRDLSIPFGHGCPLRKPTSELVAPVAGLMAQNGTAQFVETYEQHTGLHFASPSPILISTGTTRLVTTRLLMRLSPAVPAALYLCFSLQAADAQSIVPTRSVREADSLSSPRIGDKVAIAGRVVLGSGVLDSAQVNVYVQDGSGAVFVDADVPSPWLLLRLGDSVVATGTIDRRGVSQGYLDDATIALIPAARVMPAPVRIDRLISRQLTATGSRLVSIEASVVQAIAGRGEHTLTVGDTIADGSFLTVFDSDRGHVGLRLDRFRMGDRLRVTGVLVRRASPTTGLIRYTIYPRSASDIEPVGMTRRQRTALIRLAALAFGGVFSGCGGWLLLRRRRRAAENARRDIEERSARYRTLVEDTPIGIAVHQNGRIVFANRAFRGLAGLAEPEGALVSDLIEIGGSGVIPPAHTTLLRADLRRRSGAPLAVEVASSPMTYGGAACQQLVVLDASERAQAERALAEAEAQLRHSQKLEALGQLAAGVAHDFNNVLTAIKGNAQFLVDGCSKCGFKSDEAIEIDSAADRAAALTRQLLAFGRRRRSAPEVLQVDGLIRNLQSLLQRLVPESIHQTFTLAAGAACVRADAGQLEQVVVNLVVNARDAMPGGGLLGIRTDSIVVEDTGSSEGRLPSRAGTYVRISVSDSGMGMDEATRQQAFEPFFTTKEPGKGTGLGLSTVHGIVQQHDGFVFVGTSPGKGATFDVFLPRVEHAADRPVPEPSPAIVRSTGETVLLVEDEPAIRQLVDRVLARNGYTVLVAKDGMDALGVARSYSGAIHLLITDIGLPGLNGPEIASHLTRTRQGLRVLYISGYADDRIACLSPPVPGADILHKPFAPQDLLRRVRAILDVTPTMVLPSSFGLMQQPKAQR